MSKQKTIHVFSAVDMDIAEGVDLTTIDFEFVRTGKVYTNKYGTVEFTTEQLQELAQNFNADVAGMEIAVDINHSEDKKAYAWIVPGSLYIAPARKESGQVSLFGKLHRFTPEGEELVRTGAYRYFSVEVHYNVKRYVLDKLQTFKLVLMGLAFTNFPAIKGLSPTFSDLSFNHTTNMETMKIFLSALATKATVTKEEKTLLSSMVSALTEEEQAEVAEEVAEVTAKPEEEAEEAKEEVEETKEAETLSEVTALVSKLSEVNKKLSERVASLETEKKSMKLADAKASVLLSATNTTGFTKEHEKEVEAFMSTLDDSQLVQFKSLVSKVQTVQLGETGAVVQVESTDESAKALALADELRKAHPEMPQWQALSKAYEQLGV